MSKRREYSTSVAPSAPHRFLKWVINLLAVFHLLLIGFVWSTPVEVAQQWALDRAGISTYEKIESIGSAEYLLWFLRVLSTIGIILTLSIVFDPGRWTAWFAAVYRGLCEASMSENRHKPIGTGYVKKMGLPPYLAFVGEKEQPRIRGLTHLLGTDPIRTFVIRASLFAWLSLFAVHAMSAVSACARDWTYFRFKSGDDVLPNISETNLFVIRYLKESTPPDARILVASDQKLFFLSYYLRPRTLFHRMHPDSEHVIPLKDQLRKLNAYRLEDLTEEDLERMPHEYVLEYFEHPDMVDQSRLLKDSNWISFIRRALLNPTLIPPYEVRLREVRK